MTGISEPPSNWAGRHLKDNQLDWFEFDPSGLADFVRRYGAEDYPDLPDRLMGCRRAAWRCGSYVRFAESWPAGGVTTAVVWKDASDPEFEEYGIDLDPTGQPVGVELIHRNCFDK